MGHDDWMDIYSTTADFPVFAQIAVTIAGFTGMISVLENKKVVKFPQERDCT